MKVHKLFFTIALGLVSLGIFCSTRPAFAETNKFCESLGSGENFKCDDTPANCKKLSEAKFQYCMKKSDKSFEKNVKEHPERRQGDAPRGPSPKGKGVVADNPDANWNGKYTAVVTIDGRGASSYTVKQGVPIENGQQILGPDGNRYHNVWDTNLAEQLTKLGIVDEKGNPVAYTNPLTAQKHYDQARDKTVRDRAIAAGKPVLPPTVNVPNGYTKPPTVNDHRTETPKTATAPNSPPPAAAAAGTVSATTAVTNPAQQSGTVRDHRPTTPNNPQPHSPNNPPPAVGVAPTIGNTPGAKPSTPLNAPRDQRAPAVNKNLGSSSRSQSEIQ